MNGGTGTGSWVVLWGGLPLDDRADDRRTEFPISAGLSTFRFLANPRLFSILPRL